MCLVCEGVVDTSRAGNVFDGLFCRSIVTELLDNIGRNLELGDIICVSDISYL